MVRNTHGGKGHKRSKRAPANGLGDLVIKDERQMYGVVVSALGDHRLKIMCEDGVERIGTIRGSVRKSVWFVKDMHVLLSLREFDDSRVDVLHGYSYEMSKRLELDKLFAPKNENGDDFASVEFI